MKTFHKKKVTYQIPFPLWIIYPLDAFFSPCYSQVHDLVQIMEEYYSLVQSKKFNIVHHFSSKTKGAG
jgi:hypothetical protein